MSHLIFRLSVEQSDNVANGEIWSKRVNRLWIVAILLICRFAFYFFHFISFFLKMISVECELRHTVFTLYLTMNLQSYDREIENSNRSSSNGDTQSISVMDLFEGLYTAYGNRDTADTLLSLLLVFLLRLSFFLICATSAHIHTNAHTTTNKHSNMQWRRIVFPSDSLHFSISFSKMLFLFFYFSCTRTQARTHLYRH